MLTYIIRRLLISIPMLFGITFITFMAVIFSPGNMLAELKMNPTVSKEVTAHYTKQFHLDKSVFEQYGYWVWNLAHGDMGQSFNMKRPVAEVIREHAGPTLLLVISAAIFTWFLAIPLGVYCAVHQHEARDRVLSILAFLGMAVPSFFFALLLLYLFSVIGGLPVGGFKTLQGWDDLAWWHRVLDVGKHLIIPTIVLGTGGMAGMQRITRGNMLEALRQQYVLTARAKGLPEGRVIYHHALRTAINPLVTLFGFEFSELLSGAALTEIILSWPGLGSLLLNAVRSKDVHLVMGSVLISGVLLIIGNLIADILLTVVDPRISHR
jgi:peptide/nickel transport system permease protein